VSSRLNVTLLGHKDHGKSTLIGRLSFDTGSVMDDRVAEVKATCEARGHVFEYAFLLDAFTEERENGMTIDVIHAQIKGKRHHYDCIDVPGHQELIKNMLTGASHAEAGILIVSAHEGIEDQTGQHLRLAQWLGLGRLVVAVNKMDRAKHSAKRFDEIRTGMLAMVGGDAERLTFIPVAALGGENVVHHSPRMPWYTGPTLFEALEEIEIADGQLGLPLRMPVQALYPGKNGEQLVVGRIESGLLRVDQAVTIAPGNVKAKVQVIRAANKELKEASAGDNVGLVLDPPPPAAIKRGHVICAADNPIEPRTELTAPAIFLEETPKSLVAECGTAETGCEVEPLAPAAIGEVARVRLRFKHPMLAERSRSGIGRMALKHQGRIVGVVVVP
jgi:elongation factor 1-alpha